MYHNYIGLRTNRPDNMYIYLQIPIIICIAKVKELKILHVFLGYYSIYRITYTL